MFFKSLLVTFAVALSSISVADAEEPSRSFVATGLAVEGRAGSSDFPIAPETWTRSVQDLSLLLKRVRQTGRSTNRAIRTITLHQAVSSRVWRSGVVEQLGLLFP